MLKGAEITAEFFIIFTLLALIIIIIMQIYTVHTDDISNLYQLHLIVCYSKKNAFSAT